MIAKSTLAKIHIAKQQLGMDDDTYRAMLRAVGGVTSAKNLSSTGATRVLRHLERAGFVPAQGNAPARARPPTMRKAARSARCGLNCIRAASFAIRRRMRSSLT